MCKAKQPGPMFWVTHCCHCLAQFWGLPCESQPPNSAETWGEHQLPIFLKRTVLNDELEGNKLRLLRLWKMCFGTSEGATSQKQQLLLLAVDRDFFSRAKIKVAVKSLSSKTWSTAKSHGSQLAFSHEQRMDREHETGDDNAGCQLLPSYK